MTQYYDVMKYLHVVNAVSGDNVQQQKTLSELHLLFLGLDVHENNVGLSRLTK